MGGGEETGKTDAQGWSEGHKGAGEMLLCAGREVRVTGCTCWGWPRSLFQQQQPPAAVQLLGAAQRDRTMLCQDLALLDKADIWLAGEDSKASEQRTGTGRQCAHEVFQRDDIPRSRLNWKGHPYIAQGSQRCHQIAEATVIQIRKGSGYFFSEPLPLAT